MPTWLSSVVTEIGCDTTEVLLRSSQATNASSPPSYLNCVSCEGAWRSSRSTMARPELRNASSRSRRSRMAKSNSTLVKVPVLGLKQTSVPLGLPEGPMTRSGSVVSPCSKRMKCSSPFRQMRTSIHCDSAFTTAAPTPCRPPDTL